MVTLPLDRHWFLVSLFGFERHAGCLSESCQALVVAVAHSVVTEANLPSAFSGVDLPRFADSKFASVQIEGRPATTEAWHGGHQACEKPKTETKNPCLSRGKVLLRAAHRRGRRLPVGGGVPPERAQRHRGPVRPPFGFSKSHSNWYEPRSLLKFEKVTGAHVRTHVKIQS